MTRHKLLILTAFLGFPASINSFSDLHDCHLICSHTLKVLLVGHFSLIWCQLQTQLWYFLLCLLAFVCCVAHPSAWQLLDIPTLCPSMKVREQWGKPLVLAWPLSWSRDVHESSISPGSHSSHCLTQQQEPLAPATFNHSHWANDEKAGGGAVRSHIHVWMDTPRATQERSLLKSPYSKRLAVGGKLEETEPPAGDPKRGSG